MLVDTHTHFYDEWLLPDAEAAIQRALEAGVGKMIQADVDSAERPRMWEIGLRHPGVLFQMLGLQASRSAIPDAGPVSRVCDGG